MPTFDSNREKLAALDAQVVDISVYDRENATMRFPFAIEDGIRFDREPTPPMGARRHVIESREPLVINEDLTRRLLEEFGQSARTWGCRISHRNEMVIRAQGICQAKVCSRQWR